MYYLMVHTIQLGTLELLGVFKLAFLKIAISRMDISNFVKLQAIIGILEVWI